MIRPRIKRIRRIGGIMCLLSMLLSFFAGTVTVWAKESANIVTNLSYSDKGMKVTFALSENKGIWGLKFKADYDSYTMTLQSMEVGNVFVEDEVRLSNDEKKEEILFVGTRNQIENYTGNGVLVTLHFSVDSDISFREYPVSVDIIQAINVAGEDVNLNVIYGKVRGDVNADNNVTLEDASMVLKAALRIKDLEDMATGDVNRDGKVALNDANIVLKLALRIPVED